MRECSQRTASMKACRASLISTSQPSSECSGSPSAPASSMTVKASSASCGLGVGRRFEPLWMDHVVQPMQVTVAAVLCACLCQVLHFALQPAGLDGAMQRDALWRHVHAIGPGAGRVQAQQCGAAANESDEIPLHHREAHARH